MKHKSALMEALISFCVCTTCITILEGILGVVFYPEVKLDYGAFFSPPIFGAFSVLLGVVTHSKREQSVREVLIRQGIHLLLIEAMVFGLNYLVGIVYPPMVSITLALGIAAVFVLVYVVVWLNDCKSADLFNQKLKEYQARKEINA